MRRVFGHGGLRLFLLMLLDEQPRHGYDLIKLVEDRFLGMYTPSAGTVYPRLQSLEDEGLIEHEEDDGRKVYRLTEAGRRELRERRAELDDLQNRAVESARHLADAIRGEVRDSVRDMKSDLRQAMRDVSREDRWAARRARAEATDLFRSPRRHRPDGRERGPRRERLETRALRADLEALVEDVMGAAEDITFDRSALNRVREVLMDVRDAVVSALGSEAAAPEAAENDDGAETADDAEGRTDWL